MSRLTGSAQRPKSPRTVLAAAKDFAARYGVVCVLKGYRTIVAAPRGDLFLNTTGGPYMASGGMGDVLTGMIAGLISQGLSPLESARLGVYVHGMAADQTAVAKGVIGILASDIAAVLPGLWSRFMI